MKFQYFIQYGYIIIGVFSRFSAMTKSREGWYPGPDLNRHSIAAGGF